MHFLARHELIDRFKPMDEDHYLAFDSATGQLCKTVRPIPTRKKTTPSPSPLSYPVQTGQSGQRDQILEAIIRAAPETQAEQEMRRSSSPGFPLAQTFASHPCGLQNSGLTLALQRVE